MTQHSSPAADEPTPAGGTPSGGDAADTVEQVGTGATGTDLSESADPADGAEAAGADMPESTDPADSTNPPDTSDATAAAAPDESSIARQSVATQRRAKGTRLTLVLGAVSLVMIVVLSIYGFVLHARVTAVPEDGYGPSTRSVATVDDSGVITVNNGSPAALVLDVYEDPIRSECAEFEGQFGQQVAKAVDEGALEVRYRVVTSMDPASPSRDYSTRAYAALLAVAHGDGEQPGVFLRFYHAVFSADNQPKQINEGGTSDPSNEDLAELAAQAGVSDSTRQAIAEGAERAAAENAAAANLEALDGAWQKVGFRLQTPSVAHDGQLVSTNSVDWLSDLLEPEAK